MCLIGAACVAIAFLSLLYVFVVWTIGNGFSLDAAIDAARNNFANRSQQ
jgi:hypothetical protein